MKGSAILRYATFVWRQSRLDGALYIRATLTVKNAAQPFFKCSYSSTRTEEIYIEVQVSSLSFFHAYFPVASENESSV
jgi:hypothetical protein